MSAPPIPSRTRAAFTLVEVMVTLMIISGIMVAVTQILHATRVSRDTIYNIQEPRLAGPAIMDLIERDLRGILTYNRPAEFHLRVRDRVLLGHTADSLDFVTSTDSLNQELVRDEFRRADVNEVSYCCRVNPEEDDFLEIYRREGFGFDQEPFDEGQYGFLHDRIRQFDVQVFEEDGVDAEPLEEWGTDLDEEQRGLPAWIRITLELELAPRIKTERLKIVPADKRVVTFQRIFRFPEIQRGAQAVQPVPLIPVITSPSDPEGGTAPTEGDR